MSFILCIRSVSIKFLKLIIFLFFSFFGQKNVASVLENSLIATRQGDSAVQDLQVGHKILSYDLDYDWIEEAPITKLTASSCTQIHAIELEFFNDDATVAQGLLCACSEQLFYNPENQCWIEAQNLKPDTFLFEGDGRICKVVHNERIFTSPSPTYKLALKTFHVFWIGVPAVSSNRVYYVLVHNEPATIAVGGALGLGAAAVVAAGIAGAAVLYDFMTSRPSISNESSSYNCPGEQNGATSTSSILRPAMMPAIPLFQAYPLSPTQQEDFNKYIQGNTGSFPHVVTSSNSSQQVSAMTSSSNVEPSTYSSHDSTSIPNETRAQNLASNPDHIIHVGQPHGIISNQQKKVEYAFSETSYQRNAATLSCAREQSEQAWQDLIDRRLDMKIKTHIFSHPQQARSYLKQNNVSINQVCEQDRFLLTLPCVVDLLLENQEGREWVLSEYDKITHDAAHRVKTQHIDGFVYQGGLFKWIWWKLFGTTKQYYNSGYHNRIVQIVGIIKEEVLDDKEFIEEGNEEKDVEGETDRTVEEERKECKWKDITEPRSRYQNSEIDLTREEFEKALIVEGWECKKIGGKLNIQEYTKNRKKYVIRNEAKSTGGPTADFYREGFERASEKIRLKK